MTNDNTPKTASQMLFPDLATNGGAKPKLDIVDRLLPKNPYYNTTDADLAEAAEQIRDLRETVNDLNAWCEAVEADNNTLRKEIKRLRGKRKENEND